MCSICLDKMKKKISTECGHIFCNKCIIQWVRSNNANKNKCPICRGILSLEWIELLKWGLHGCRVTRYSIAKRRVFEECKKLYTLDGVDKSKQHTKMYNIAVKIRKEERMFVNNSRFKNIFNYKIIELAQMFKDDKFLLLLKLN